jgi:hypothetical protein
VRLYAAIYILFRLSFIQTTFQERAHVCDGVPG